MTSTRIPDRLRAAAQSSARAEFGTWLTDIPDLVRDLSTRWELSIGDPFEPGGQCAWVAPATAASDQHFALKLGWRHPEAEGEARALEAWEGNGAVQLLRHEELPDTNVLLLERCMPGQSLSASLPEPERDPIIAGLLRKLWEVAFTPTDFAPLSEMCDRWAAECEGNPAHQLIDQGIVRTAMELLRSMPRDATENVLLFTDLHGDNVLAGQRASWLAIDPKPHVGDPAFDVIQHIGTSYSRMQSDPAGLVGRMSDLTDVDEERVRHWLFCRAVQERPGKPWLSEAITQLAP